MDVFYYINDNVLSLQELANGLTGALLASATVGATLETASGTAVSGLATGSTWPLTMSPATGATGTYRCTLPYTLSLSTGTIYYAHVTASAGAGLYASWRLPVRCMTRT